MNWWEPLLPTLRLITVTIVSSLALGIPAAWAATTLARHRKPAPQITQLFLLLMVVAIATPMILHAAAWEATAGKFGWLSLSQTATRWVPGFAGLFACGWIHGIFGSAIVTLATWYGTQLVPQSLLQGASLDAPPLRIWWTVQLPLAWPWILSATILNAALAATEMTVVDLYGYRTIADAFYLRYAIDPNLTSIMVTLALPMCFAFALITVLLSKMRSLRSESGAVQFDGWASGSVSERPSRWITYVAVAILFLALLLIIAIPIAGLIGKLGHDVIVEGGNRSAHWSWSRAIHELVVAPRTFASEYQWTLMLGGLTGLLATAFAWPLAAIGRQHRRAETMIDVISVMLFCIPGPIIGMAVVSLFQVPFPGSRFLYETTIIPTVLAISVRATTIAYWILRSGYRGIPEHVLESVKLESTLSRRIWQIDRPLLATSLLISVIAAGIVASGDVPVTLPVAPPGVSTVGTRLFGLLHSGARYQEAALAAWYLGLVCLMILITATHVRRRHDKMVSRFH
ncbi:hypothetical protein Pla52o_14460 [Novipirellula galeiformis]|uniref:ABC transmembrane type-1 domain-containing protein n=1 Tax=Novipirellula galeiformis TaxID=2528004 RepID=A0A5C6CL28_9BACT|nr:amino acid ABC transporter permease [Novipirellula galeiformis]TWU25148.1 hypothetical protein Pla52o_14460 [Novipirellula galeiformis]